MEEDAAVQLYLAMENFANLVIKGGIFCQRAGFGAELLDFFF